MAGRAFPWGRREGGEDRPERPEPAPGPGERPWLHPSELPADPLDRPPPPTRRHRVAVPLTAGIAGALAALGVTALALDSGGSPSTAAASSTSLGVPATGADGGETVAVVTQRVAPAVVAVSAWSGAHVRYGSGVMYRADGVVLTTASLVSRAAAFEVTVPGGETVTADLVGTDPANDLAVLRASADAPAFAVAVNTLEPGGDDLEVGQACLLVGAGGAGGGTWAARGVLAATGRVVPTNDHWMIDVMEVDTEIHPEASGGGLFDMRGRFLGILSRAGHDTVTGTLVVPAATALRSVEHLLASGRVDHPWLGVATVDTAEPVHGALVKQVAASSPAAVAGLGVDDVIVSLDGEPVAGMATLLQLVRRHEVGDTVTIEVRRGDAVETISVRLTARP